MGQRRTLIIKYIHRRCFHKSRYSVQNSYFKIKECSFPIKCCGYFYRGGEYRGTRYENYMYSPIL